MNTEDSLGQEFPLTLTGDEIVLLLSLIDHTLKHWLSGHKPDLKVELVRTRHKLHESLGEYGDMIPQDGNFRSSGD